MIGAARHSETQRLTPKEGSLDRVVRWDRKISIRRLYDPAARQMLSSTPLPRASTTLTVFVADIVVQLRVQRLTIANNLTSLGLGALRLLPLARTFEARSPQGAIRELQEIGQAVAAKNGLIAFQRRSSRHCDCRSFCAVAETQYRFQMRRRFAQHTPDVGR